MLLYLHLKTNKKLLIPYLLPVDTIFPLLPFEICCMCKMHSRFQKFRTKHRVTNISLIIIDVYYKWNDYILVIWVKYNILSQLISPFFFLTFLMRLLKTLTYTCGSHLWLALCFCWTELSVLPVFNFSYSLLHVYLLGFCPQHATKTCFWGLSGLYVAKSSGQWPILVPAALDAVNQCLLTTTSFTAHHSSHLLVSPLLDSSIWEPKAQSYHAFSFYTSLLGNLIGFDFNTIYTSTKFLSPA